MGSSIPLPALSVNPPTPQPNMLDQYSRLMQIKQQQQNAPLQQQAAQQQVQSGAIDLQEKQQQQKNQQAVTKAMTDWDGKDYNQLYPAILKNGGDAQAVIGLKTSVLKQQADIALAAKNNGAAAESQITAKLKQNDLVNGALSPLADPKSVPDAQLPQMLLQTVQSLTQQGALDPQHAQAAAQLAQSGDPTKIREGVMQFRNTLMAQSQITEQAAKQAGILKDAAQTAEANATTAKTNAEVGYYQKNGGAPGVPVEVQQQNDWLAKHPGKGPADFAVSQAAAKAGAEENARMPGEMALARQRQALSQGDPNAAAQLLVNKDATLSELKARGATPEFIEKTLTAAHQISGGQYNAMAADAEFQVAKSEDNNKFFGSAKSLTDPGGNLDQLLKLGKKLPSSQIPAFNTIADWKKAATGSGPLAEYAAKVVGVADDYAKVMGGGTGSDTARQQAVDLIKANASPEARASAVNGIRTSAQSQIDSRIGNNSVLKRMYGSPSGQQASSPLTVTAPNGKAYSFKDQASADAFKKAAGIQ